MLKGSGDVTCSARSFGGDWVPVKEWMRPDHDDTGRVGPGRNWNRPQALSPPSRGSRARRRRRN